MTRLEGYAALFEPAEATIAGLFRERIARGAFADTLARGDDIRSLYNHDIGAVLGRVRAKTLALREDARGLFFTVSLNEADPAAAAVAARVQRRDVTGSSFWFAVDRPDDEEWTPGRAGQLPLRRLLKLRLVDVGPVSFPAYEDTTVAVRTGHPLDVVRRMRARIAIAQARAER